MKSTTTQLVIIVKYFKILAQAYNLITMMSESFREGSAVIPFSFKKFLEALDAQLMSIADFL